MAVTAGWYDIGMANAFGGTASGGTVIDWEADTLKCALLISHSIGSATHDTYSDVSGDEVAATGGYTTGGTTLQSAALTVGSGTVTFDAADFTYSGSTISASQAVIYDASIAGSILIGWVDFGGTVSSTGGDWTMTWDSAGIFTIAMT